MGEIDAVYLAYTRFVNTMMQTPVVEQLLPLPEGKLDRPDPGYSWDYLYEPNPKSVLDELMVRYIEALIYQALAENMASEHSARVVAMKAASDNAKKIINELQLSYNKAKWSRCSRRPARPEPYTVRSPRGRWAPPSPHRRVCC